MSQTDISTFWGRMKTLEGLSRTFDLSTWPSCFSEQGWSSLESGLFSGAVWSCGDGRWWSLSLSILGPSRRYCALIWLTLILCQVCISCISNLKPFLLYFWWDHSDNLERLKWSIKPKCTQILQATFSFVHPLTYYYYIFYFDAWKEVFSLTGL